DFIKVLGQSHKNTYIFLHDTNIYLRELVKHAGVKKWLKFIKREEESFEVIMIKQGLPATLTDIVREDLASPKILIGIFMSPFSVHYNRAPLPGKVNFIRHYPAKVKNFCMAPMHWRTLLRRAPFYENSRHIIHN